MKSAARGKLISEPQVEVTHISIHGLWLLAGNRELFLPFEQFPWFRDASVAQIQNVQWPAPQRFYWPDLDVDLAVESIDHPERFPLVARLTAGKPPLGRAKSGRERTRQPKRRLADVEQPRTMRR